MAAEADTTVTDSDTSAFDAEALAEDASAEAVDTFATEGDATAPGENTSATTEDADAPAFDAEAPSVDASAEDADTIAPDADTAAQDEDTSAPVDAGVASASTGQSDYMPGDTVDISGEGFAPNAEVTVTLTKPDGTATEWTVTADDAGQIVTNYELTDGIDGAYFVSLCDGNNAGATLFTDPVTVLSPNGNGAVTQLTDYPSAGSNWQKVADVTNDDTTYVYTTNTAGRKDLYAIGNLTDTVKPDDPVLSSTTHATGVWSNNPTITMVWNGVSDPGSSSANSVTVKAICRTTAATPGGSASVGVKPQGGTESWATAGALGTTYSQFSSEWDTNPTTGQPWTYADINNLQAGITLKSPSSSSQARSTTVWLEIDSAAALASGVYRYYYEWNDATPDLYMANQGTGVQHSVTQTLTQGTRTFYVYTKDNTGNNSNTISSGPYLIDLTKPTVTTSRTPAANSYGWNKTNVTASYTARDALSGLVTPASGSYVFTTEGANQSTTFTATDQAGNTTTKAVTVSIDKTKPTISGSPSPGANAYGWNNTNVIVHFIGDDALSGIATVTPDVTITSEGTNRSATGTATDKAGNKSDSIKVGGINIDKTAPKVTGSPDRPAIYNGWYNGPVTISWTATDSLSKVNTTNTGNDLSPDTVSNEGMQIATATAYDYADNRGTGTYAVKIDQSGPTVTGSPDQPANINGWYNGPVTISWAATDTLSGVNYANPGNNLVPDTLSAEGSGQTATAKAYDYVNNMGTGTYTVNIDKTAPTISGSRTSANAHGWNNNDVTVSFTANDVLSGVASVTPDTTLSSDGAGQSVTGTAIDKAGNSASTAVGGINIDKTDPALAEDLSRTGMDEITVTLTGNDALSGVDLIRYSTDGGATWTTVYSPTATFTISGAGDHSLSNLVFDIAGNQYLLPDQVVTIEGSETARIAGSLTVAIDVMGTVAAYPITADGTLLADVKVASPDNALVLEIPAGSQILNEDGTLASQIQIIAAEKATVPAGYQMISAYNLLPAGITFSQEAILTANYAPGMMPEDRVAAMAFYDEAAGKWVGLETGGRVASIEIPNAVTSHIDGAGSFAVFAKIPPAE